MFRNCKLTTFNWIEDESIDNAWASMYGKLPMCMLLVVLYQHCPQQQWKSEQYSEVDTLYSVCVCVSDIYNSWYKKLGS